MTTKELNTEFWKEVITDLMKKHHLARNIAVSIVKKYRTALRRHHVEDSVYHLPASHVASTLSTAKDVEFKLSARFPSKEEDAA